MRLRQDEPPAKKQLKARPCEGLSAVQPRKHPCGRGGKWKMKSFHHLFDNSGLFRVNSNSRYVAVSDETHQLIFIPY